MTAPMTSREELLAKALTDILDANDEFRKGMPDDWDGDPLQDACAAGRKSLAVPAQQTAHPHQGTKFLSGWMTDQHARNATPSTGLPAPAPHAEVRAKMEWPSREIVAREVRLAMLDNPTEDSFNKRAEKREAIANQTADAILARFTAALPQQDRCGK